MPGRITEETGIGFVIDPSDLNPEFQGVYGNPLRVSIVDFLYFSDWEYVTYDIQNVSSSVITWFGDFEPVPNFSDDFHQRWWVIPQILNLSNPKLNVNIPFDIWNTFYTEQTISVFTVTGSNALLFDIGVASHWDVGEMKIANVKILPGEPSIDAELHFTTQGGDGFLGIIASIADTFNSIPEIPVREVWEYKTDILTSHNGNQQRISLRRLPRLRISYKTMIESEMARKLNYNLLQGNIQFESLVPFYQYATNLTQMTPIGGTKIFVDLERGNFRDGQFAILVNPETLDIIIGRIHHLEPDGFVMATSANSDLSTNWIAVPAVTCVISNGSEITMNSISGMMSIEADSIIEPEHVRPGANRSIGFFDGLIHLDRRPMSGAKESFSYEKEIIDNEVGVRLIKSSKPHTEIEGPRQFNIQRIDDPEEMDYWRSFADEVKGSFKPFLLSTWLDDLTLNSPVSQGTSQIVIKEGHYVSTYFPYETWQHLQIEYANGDISQHTVTVAQELNDGTAQISLNPPLLNIPEHTLITKISYLMKVMCSDTITLEHYATSTVISFTIKTTDYG